MDGADVRYIPAIREWLAQVGAYRDECAEAMAMARMEIRRGQEWLHAQLGLWQQAVRKLEELVHQRKMELSAKKVPGPTGRMPDTTLEEKALRRARAELEHAQDKVQACKGWVVRLDRAVDEVFAGPAHRLEAFLDGDLARGQAVLGRQAGALEQYAELRAGAAAPPASPPAAPTKEGSP